LKHAFVWQRLDAVARSLFPFLITVLLVIISMVPVRVPTLAPIMPVLSLVAVYYWAVYRPELMPIWAVFLIGLLQDLLIGDAVGAGIITLLCVHALIGWQRRFFAQASFSMVWCIFMLVAAGAMILLWLLTSFAMSRSVDPWPALFQYFMTVAIYPFFAWLMAQGQRLFQR
jgi:rod shape-determining protein MreD